ncbi:ABC transporter permease [Phytohabitans kaempferiae]|uniref:ABC transporter permease n=1 Tax=Phytohabitans kaempferiae TaxID=1620943 RepID=A0ABV6M4D0_9ACTN
MARFLIQRTAIGLVLLYFVVTAIFLMLHVLPGDPAELLLVGQGGTATPEAIAALRTALGLDQPLATQYWDYLTGLLHGDLGTSLQDGEPVAAYVVQRLPRTLLLVLSATVVAVAVGIPLGAWTARRGGTVDAVARALVSTGIAAPAYVIGLFLVYLFALKLRWLPSSGYVSFAEDPIGMLQRLILPTLTLAIGFTAIVMRMTRAAVLEVISQDWVRTATAAGLRSRRVLVAHVIRNALSPVLTVVGLQMGAFLGGTVIIERMFNWPGLSGLLVGAVENRDYPLVQGIVIVIAALFIGLNMLVDLSYPLLDPRGRKR